MTDILTRLTELASVQRKYENEIYAHAAQEIRLLRHQLEQFREARNLLEEWYIGDDPKTFDIKEYALRVHAFLTATNPIRK